MKNLTIFLLALLSSAVTVTPVLAAEPNSITSTSIVRISDLDLGTAEGKRSLEHRLSIAIVDACGEASNVDLEGRNDVRACRIETRAMVAAERDRLVQFANGGNATVLAAR